jgi:hypothetical protein
MATGGRTIAGVIRGLGIGIVSIGLVKVLASSRWK